MQENVAAINGMKGAIKELVGLVVNKVDCDDDQMLALVAGLCVFIASIYLAPFYFDGDQWVYDRAYKVVEGVDLASAYYFYERAISGGEYLHFLIVWLGSTLAIDKNLLMALANSMLAAYSVILVRRWGANLYIALLLVLTNFYWYVLYFSAERLKFGVLFLVLSLLSIETVWACALFSAMALMSHHSLIFIYAGIWVMMSARLIAVSNLSPTAKLVRVGGTGALIVAAMALGAFHIRAKLPAYLNAHDIGNYKVLGPVILLTSLSCWYGKKVLEPVLLYMPVLAGIVLMGGSRLNMMAYFLFLYYGLRARSGINLGVIATFIYLGQKSAVYVSNVLEFGHGFP